MSKPVYTSIRMYASSQGYGETALLYRPVLAFADCLCNKYFITVCL